MIPVIDCHCHFGTGDQYSKYHRASDNLHRYLKDITNTDIEKAVLFPHPNDNYRQDNKRIARIVQNYPNRFFQFVLVHPYKDRKKIDNIIQSFLKTKTIRGIKVHRHDAPITQEICEVAKWHSLPILYDTMGDLKILHRLGEMYPSIPFIIPHFGSFTDSWKVHDAIIPYLTEYPNLYTDTSGIRRLDILEKGIVKTDGDKILFGTDSPFLNPIVELTKVKALNLPERLQRKILYKNISRVLRRSLSQSEDLNLSRMEYFLS